MALLNSYILYEANTDAGQRLMRHDYIVAVVESLCLGDGVVLGVPAPPLPVAGLLPPDLQRLPGKREGVCRLFGPFGRYSQAQLILLHRLRSGRSPAVLPLHGPPEAEARIAGTVSLK